MLTAWLGGFLRGRGKMAPNTNFEGNITIITYHLGIYHQVINSGSKQGEVWG